MIKERIVLLTLACLATVPALASQPLRRTVAKRTADGHTVMVERRGDSHYAWWVAAGNPSSPQSAQAYEMGCDHVLYPIDAETLRQRRDAVVAELAVQPKAGLHRSMNASTPDGLGAYGRSGMGTVCSLGAPTIPVIMMAYSDLDFLPENDVQKISRFLNEEGYHDEKYAVGSVADYFRLSSNGHFTPHFDVVAKVKLEYGYKHYGAHSGGANDARRSDAVREAIELAEAQGVDFSKYSTNGRAPLISIIHAGPGEQEDYGDDYDDFFWAHFSSTVLSAKTTTFNSYLLTNETMRDFDAEGNVTAEYMTGIGTFCHEFGHALGLPDMYDVNGETEGEGHTPGYWDVMDYQFMYDGFRPMEYSAYERSLMGWLKVEDLDKTSLGSSYTLFPLGTSEENRVEAYRIVNDADEREYFILENRRSGIFHQGSMLGEGMLVWRIAYDSGRWASNMVNTNAQLQRVMVVPADRAWQPNQDINKRDVANKRYTFTGDVFPGYANVTTFDSSIGQFLTGSFDDFMTDIHTDADGVVHFSYGEPTNAVSWPLLLPSSSAAYDLQGRVVQTTALGSGIYISNNKKIIR